MHVASPLWVSAGTYFSLLVFHTLPDSTAQINDKISQYDITFPSYLIASASSTSAAIYLGTREQQAPMPPQAHRALITFIQS